MKGIAVLLCRQKNFVFIDFVVNLQNDSHFVNVRSSKAKVYPLLFVSLAPSVILFDDNVAISSAFVVYVCVNVIIIYLAQQFGNTAHTKVLAVKKVCILWLQLKLYNTINENKKNTLKLQTVI